MLTATVYKVSSEISMGDVLFVQIFFGPEGILVQDILFSMFSHLLCYCSNARP